MFDCMTDSRMDGNATADAHETNEIDLTVIQIMGE